MNAVWWSLAPSHGVLELDWGLELHVLATPSGAVAWWLYETGARLGPARVGRC
jgi:hypothetical protein